MFYDLVPCIPPPIPLSYFHSIRTVCGLSDLIQSHIFLFHGIFPRKQFSPRGDSFSLHKSRGTRHDHNFTRKRLAQWGRTGAIFPRAISCALQIATVFRAYLKLLEVVPAPLVHPHHRVGRLTWQRQILALVDDVLVVDHTERTRHVEHCNGGRKMEGNQL